MRLLRDNSGASAAEYALILALVGTAVAAASLAFGVSVRGASYIQATSPSGTVYQCTANCTMADEEYCSAINRTQKGFPNPPTFDPALPTSDPACS